MEKNNKEHYQATMKAQQVEEIEKELVQSKTEVQRLEAKVAQLQTESAEMKDLRELLHRTGKDLDEIYTHISVIDNDSCRAAAQELDRIISELRKEAKARRPDNPEKVAELKAKVRELSLALEEEKRVAAKAQTAEKRCIKVELRP